ncbi:MAG TPA: hypothetical protein VLA04_04640, partial [Verrucomicrobiae bacterium]|nr:hypothetical protein [Verrucomicrobiae bacterium]
FDESEANRMKRLADGLPPQGEMDERINQLTYLAGTGDKISELQLKQVLEKKRLTLEGKPPEPWRPATQTQRQRA